MLRKSSYSKIIYHDTFWNGQAQVCRTDDITENFVASFTVKLPGNIWRTKKGNLRISDGIRNLFNERFRYLEVLFSMTRLQWSAIQSSSLPLSVKSYESRCIWILTRTINKTNGRNIEFKCFIFVQKCIMQYTNNSAVC